MIIIAGRTGATSTAQRHKREEVGLPEFVELYTIDLSQKVVFISQHERNRERAHQEVLALRIVGTLLLQDPLFNA